MCVHSKDRTKGGKHLLLEVVQGTTCFFYYHLKYTKFRSFFLIDFCLYSTKKEQKSVPKTPSCGWYVMETWSTVTDGKLEAESLWTSGKLTHIKPVIRWIKSTCLFPFIRSAGGSIETHSERDTESEPWTILSFSFLNKSGFKYSKTPRLPVVVDPLFGFSAAFWGLYLVIPPHTHYA